VQFAALLSYHYCNSVLAVCLCLTLANKTMMMMMMMIMMMMIMMMMMMMSPLDYATGQFSSLAGVCLKTSKRVLILPFPQKVEG